MSPSESFSAVCILEFRVKWLLLLLLPSTTGQSLTEKRDAGPRLIKGEYCERESFEATCSVDEVILVRSALYGRMQFGKCVQTEYGAFGCSADVLRIVDSWCSGRRDCLFPITDLHSSNACPRELIAYLEASYECIPVLQCPEKTCSSGDSIRIPPSGAGSGFLASSVTATLGCGSVSCPWLIQAKVGQRLNITFYSFVLLNEQQQHQGKLCQRLATIIDPTSHLSKDVTICNKDTHTISQSTSGNSAQIKIYPGNPSKPANFIVHYQAFGCPDFETPIGGWSKRDGNLIAVGCNDKQRTWHLTCDGNNWVGQVGECDPTDATPSWNVQSALEKVKSTTEGILMVIGLGVLIGVITGCSMLTIVIIVIKRRRRRMALQYDCRREALYSEDGATILGDQLYTGKQQVCTDKQLLGFEPPTSYDPTNFNRALYDRNAGGGGGGDACIPGGGLSQLCSGHINARYRQQDLNAQMVTTSGLSGPTPTNFVADLGKEHPYETPNFST